MTTEKSGAKSVPKPPPVPLGGASIPKPSGWTGIRLALQNPTLSGDAVRREADNLIAKLDGITAADNLKAAIEAQQADEQAQQAAEAQRRAEAVSHNRGMVAKMHPGWTAADIDAEAQKWAAEDASAIAALNLRDALAGGYDK